MPRMVILRHEDHPGRGRHWDLMLEAGSVLWTWALSRKPTPGCDLLGERIADHRLAYLRYEGPLTLDRGSVTRCFAAEFTWVTETEERLAVQLAGDGGRLQLDTVLGSGAAWRIAWKRQRKDCRPA